MQVEKLTFMPYIYMHIPFANIRVLIVNSHQWTLHLCRDQDVGQWQLLITWNSCRLMDLKIQIQCISKKTVHFEAVVLTSGSLDTCCVLG